MDENKKTTISKDLKKYFKQDITKLIDRHMKAIPMNKARFKVYKEALDEFNDEMQELKDWVIR